MVRLLACVSLAVLALGCGGRTPAARPPAAPSGSEVASPAAARLSRIAFVDLARAARAYPRWPEVTALDRQIGELQAKIAVEAEVPRAPVRVELPKVDLTPEMKAAVERMRPELQREAEAVKAAARKELDAYVAQLRADQQKKMEARRVEVEAGLTKAVGDKQQALSKDTTQFQQQVLAEYRLPLLNLKLKLEAVQPASKGDADRLTQQIQALTKERDEKVASHEKANGQALQQFQKEQIEAFNAQLKVSQDQLAKEGQQLVDERAAKLTEEVRAQLEAKQAEFNKRLRGQEEAIVAAARDAQTRQAAGAKAQAERQIQTQLAAGSAKLRTLQEELLAAQRGRARLMSVILADLRIEAAALAQEKGWDVVLTQAIAAPGAVDATDDLIARLKR